jgi:hypothetical protein
MTRRIKIDNCSVRIKSIAEPLGFKSLVKFRRFLLGCTPQYRLYYGITYINAKEALRLVDKEYESFGFTMI